jgi:uncharacterized protein YbjT (DUF2867 family)
MQKRHAIVVGANGLIGKELTQCLIDNDIYEKVTLVSRRYFEVAHPKIELEVIDYRELHKHWELFTCDDLFYTLGTTIKNAGKKDTFFKVEYDYCVNIAKIAHHNKVKQFLLVSSKGANPKSLIFYAATKGKIEENLKQIGYPSLHIFRPSVLLGQREEFRFLEKLSQGFLKMFNFMMIGFLKNIKGMPSNNLAKAMVMQATKKEKGVHIYSNRKIHEMLKNG